MRELRPVPDPSGSLQPPRRRPWLAELWAVGATLLDGVLRSISRTWKRGRRAVRV